MIGYRASKMGDRVRVVNPDSVFCGEYGVVQLYWSPRDRSPGASVGVSVRLDGDSLDVPFGVAELEAVDPLL